MSVRLEIVVACLLAFTSLTRASTSDAGRDSSSQCREATITSQCMSCICQVESNCNTAQGCNPDGTSDSCGLYQIKQSYWVDGGRQGTDWRTCAQDTACAERTIRNYMNRYATCSRLGHTPTCQDWARIHNGGPNGFSSSSTVGYWGRVHRAGCIYEGKPARNHDFCI